MNSRYVFLSGCLFLLLACLAGRKQSGIEIQRVTIDKNFKDILNYSPTQYAIQEITMKGDTLLLDVLVFKTTKKDDFELATNNRPMKSLPPQINLYLFMKQDALAKNKPTHRKLYFDVSLLKMQNQGKIILNINDRNRQVVYTY